MRVRVPLVSVAVITGLSMLACGSGPIESYRGKTSWSPPVNDPTALQRQFTVPPDRSLHSLTVGVTAPTATDAAAQLRADLDALRVAVSDEEACTVHIRSYEPPARTGRDVWRASAQLVLDVELVGAPDSLARMDHIDACRGLVLPKTTYGQEDVANDRTHTVALHAGALDVDAPEEHLQALMDRRARRLAAVAETPSAPQLHPEDYRCVPTGAVGIGDRTLDGVVLQLDLQCRVEAADDAPAEG